MAKMRAIDAAVHVLEREGVTHAFGVPGAAINPLYSALKARGSITHVLARHVEGASHMAEGYTRAVAGNIDLQRERVNVLTAEAQILASLGQFYPGHGREHA